MFLTIAAPGLHPIIKPKHTLSRPEKDTTGKSLGKLPNGERLGEREQYATPFPYVSAGEITSDLPNIGNCNVQTCIPHPDHKVSYQPNRKERILLYDIPRNPPGSGYAEAYTLDLIPMQLQKPGKEAGKAYRRIKKTGLIPTITTTLSIQDSRNGASIHWDQNRPITIMDTRRAQGYLDEESIIGDREGQFIIVGNGVDRKVSFALGLSLRRALEQSAKLFRKESTAGFNSWDEMLVEADKRDPAFNITSNSTTAYMKTTLHEAGGMRSDVLILLQLSSLNYLTQLLQPYYQGYQARYEVALKA